MYAEYLVHLYFFSGWKSQKSISTIVVVLRGSYRCQAGKLTKGLEYDQASTYASASRIPAALNPSEDGRSFPVAVWLARPMC